jgi:hypothetical protein
MPQFKCEPITLLGLIESCSTVSAGGLDKSKSERRAAAVAQDRAASQATTTEPQSCAVTMPARDLDNNRDIAAELSRQV